MTHGEEKMNYNQPHKFYCGVDLHARTMFTHVLDDKSKTVFEKDLPADSDEFLFAIKPYRKNSVVGCECMFAWYSVTNLLKACRFLAQSVCGSAC